MRRCRCVCLQRTSYRTGTPYHAERSSARFATTIRDFDLLERSGDDFPLLRDTDHRRKPLVENSYLHHNLKRPPALIIHRLHQRSHIGDRICQTDWPIRFDKPAIEYAKFTG